MLSILGFVFGWILRILVILLLLILILLVAVLLVPIRYEAEASYREKTPMAQFGVSWLLHFLSVKGTFDTGQGLVYRIKVLGITVKDSRRERKPKSEEKERDKDKSKDKNKDKKPKSERKKWEEKIEGPETEKLPEERETAVPTEIQEPVNLPEKREMAEPPRQTEVSESQPPEPEAQLESEPEPELTRADPAEEIRIEEPQEETQTETQKETQIEEIQEEVQAEEAEIRVAEDTEMNEAEAEKPQAAGAQIKEARITEPQTEEPQTEEVRSKEDLTGEIQGIPSEENPTESQREEKEEKEDKGDSGKAESEETQSQPSGFERIQVLVLGLIAGLSEKFQGLAQKKEALQAKIQNILNFLQAPENQETFRFLVKELKKLLSHIRPRTFRLTGRFGSADPALTGQVLGAVYMLYPIYGDSIRLTGDFEEEVLEGEMALKGRIRLGTLAVIAIRVVGNKQVRKWIRR